MEHCWIYVPQRLSLSRRIGVSTAVAVAHVDAHVRCVKPQPCRKCESIPYYPALRRTISFFTSSSRCHFLELLVAPSLSYCCSDRPTHLILWYRTRSPML